MFFYYFKNRFFILCSSFMPSWILDFDDFFMPIKLINYRYFQVIAPLFNLFPFILQESFEFRSAKNLYTNLDILGGYVVFSIEKERKNSNCERIFILWFCFDNLNIQISCNTNFEHNHLEKAEVLEKNHFKNNITSISSKKREAGMLNKRCLTLNIKIKILNVVKKRKISCREIAEQFKIGKTQAANVVKNEASLRAEYENFQ